MKIGPVLLGALLVASCTPVDSVCNESATEAPTTATQAPTTDTQAPTTATQAPTTATQAPTNATQAPTTATQAPTTAANASSTAGHTGCDSATQAPTAAAPSVCTSTQNVKVMLVIPASKCVGDGNMTNIRNFVIQLFDTLIINDNGVQVGILTTGGNSTKLVTPITGNKTVLNEGARSVVYQGGEENTAEAIRVARQELTSPEGPELKYLFLFMACNSTNRTAAVAAADFAKTLSIDIGVAAVESLVDANEARKISSGESFYFPVSGIPKLDTIVTNVANKICELKAD